MKRPLLTFSALVRVYRPYQDTFGHGMADVAEDAERIEQHIDVSSGRVNGIL